MRYILLLFFCSSLVLNAQQTGVIPQPVQAQVKAGVFNFSKGVSIRVQDPDIESMAISSQLATALFKQGIKVLPTGEQGKNVILRLLPANGITSGVGSYHIRIFTDSFLIESTSHQGLHYGCQSAIQLFANSRKEILLLDDGSNGLSTSRNTGSDQIQGAEINDYPQYQWRGMEIDVCRHFFDKETIKKYIDLLASLKMNVFHWHLTDDQGWRIEIKKYPKLTTTGAWRTEKDGTKYGGFYTQEDIKEIVAYANERYVTIVPEIELPGHSSAAIAAYPELSCEPATEKTVPNTWGIKRDIYCPSDYTFGFLRDVLDEVCGLFPGKYIHLGGDEAPKASWKKSELAQALIKKEGLKNEEQLQHYFLKKMEDYVATKGKTVIGWGEIVRGGLSDSVIVMSWMDKSAGVKAAKKGNRVIMTPRFFCYFDYPNSIKDKKGAWYMTYLPTKKVYQFNPQAKSLNSEQQKLILGGQANVWTEHITNEKQLRHQTMPRLAAMSETLWTKPESKNYKSFSERLKNSRVFH